MQWFRMYGEFATDPKVQMLSEIEQRRYVMLLCLRCSNVDVTLQDEQVAFQLRISNDEWLQTKSILQSKNLINNDNTPSKWDKRQYTSDTSTERVRAYRERQKKGVKRKCNVTVTPPDTDTDTDTEYKKDTKVSKKANRFLKPTPDEVKQYCLERKNSVNPDRFYDFYESKGWHVGKNKMKCWKAAVRTWEQKDEQRTNGTGKKSTRADDIAEAIRGASLAKV